MNRFLPAAIAALVALLLTPTPSLLAKDAAKTRRIALIAGRPSHPSGMHEFRAGCLLFQKALAGVPNLEVQVYSNGWPTKVEGGNPPRITVREARRTVDAHDEALSHCSACSQGAGCRSQGR